MKIKIKKLHPDAIVTTYGSEGAACFDLYAADFSFSNREDAHDFSGEKNSQAICDTGLSFEIPKEHVMLIFSRSGHGFNYETRLSNCVAVIDSDFRGSVKIALTRDSFFTPFRIKKGDRIAQAIIIPYPKIQFEEVETLSETERGEGGFGSTGQ